MAHGHDTYTDRQTDHAMPRYLQQQAASMHVMRTNNEQEQCQQAIANEIGSWHSKPLTRYIFVVAFCTQTHYDTHTHTVTVLLLMF